VNSLVGGLDIVLDIDDGYDVELLLDERLLHLQAHLQVRVLPARRLQVKPSKQTTWIKRTFFLPGSGFYPSRIRITEFKYFNPKNGFQAL
jgi:hypothetical protein